MATPETTIGSTRRTEGLIRLAGVSKAFGDRLVMAGLDLTIGEGEFVCVVGPSGGGKSTLLNMISGLDEATTGVVSFRGRAVSGLNNEVGYITQRDLLLPWRTAANNIRLPLELRGWSRTAMAERVREILAMTGLDHAADSYPYELSGGMRKRVSIGRVLAYSPSVLLMDEPFASLDAQLRLQMHEELLRMWQDSRVTSVVFVTHDLVEAITLADRVVVIAGQPGRVDLELPIEIDRPRRVVDVQSHPRYADYFQRLWSALGHDQPTGGAQ
ncbi:ABC transporter ATP-binding protein [Pseudonocardia ailaonensis]|uniref:ABC transporter ATP-binding protein n=1 Tax=Pseudonocardia ailaonensis TaxID=367279 RepID=A0ABN2N4K5_9PSEU